MSFAAGIESDSGPAGAEKEKLVQNIQFINSVTIFKNVAKFGKKKQKIQLFGRQPKGLFSLNYEQTLE